MSGYGESDISRPERGFPHVDRNELIWKFCNDACVAFGVLRVATVGRYHMSASLDSAFETLRPLLEKEQLIIFVGSGISSAAGLPTWDGFLKKFLDLATTLPLGDKYLETIRAIVRDADEGRETDPVKVATVVKAQILQAGVQQNRLALSKYNTWLSNELLSKSPHDRHRAIVTTNYPFILTTNYDMLLETAAYDEGLEDLAKSTYSYTDGHEVMSSIHERRPCIIHIHGMAGQNLGLDNIIFTADDYYKIVKKKYDGFSFALRLLFSQYSTLFVGYGASDPHMEDISEELSQFFKEDRKEYPLPRSFLIVNSKHANHIFEHWKNDRNTTLFTVDDYSEYDNFLWRLQSISPRKNRFQLSLNMGGHQ